MREIKGFGWRNRVALVVVLAFAAAAGCVQRTDILREAGVRAVRLRISWLSFPRETGIARVVAEELGTPEEHAGIAVMTSDCAFADQVKARFSWVEGFTEKSQEVYVKDMSAFEPIIWEESSRLPARPGLHDLSISSRSTLSVATDSYPVNLVLSDRQESVRCGDVLQPWEGGAFILGLSAKLSEHGMVMGFCPVVEVNGKRRERLRELAFEARVRVGESVVLATAGAPGTFGQAALIKEKRRADVADDVPLPLSPPCSVWLDPVPRAVFDQITVIVPLAEL